MLSFEERGKYIRDAIKKGVKPLEVNCTGVPEHNIRNIRKVLSAEVLNENAGYWEKVNITEYTDACAICGKFIKVKAIIGTTWIPGCCSEHSKRILEEIEEKAKTRTAKYLSGKNTLDEVLEGSIS